MTTLQPEIDFTIADADKLKGRDGNELMLITSLMQSSMSRDPIVAIPWLAAGSYGNIQGNFPNSTTDIPTIRSLIGALLRSGSIAAPLSYIVQRKFDSASVYYAEDSYDTGNGPTYIVRAANLTESERAALS